MTTRIYLRASTKDQDAQRALNQLDDLNQTLKLGESVIYIENFSGTKLDRPELNRLLTEANQGDTLLVEWTVPGLSESFLFKLGHLT